MTDQPAKLVTISATTREKSGKGYARKLRQNNKIPGNLVQGGKSTPIELDPKLLTKAVREGDRKFNLDMGSGPQLVKIQELQIDAVRRTAVHVDLMPVK